MENRLVKHLDKLHSFDNQRKAWLVLSAFVVLGVIGIIFSWDAVTHSKIIYLIVSIGLVLSVTWWYWTMRLVRHLIESKTSEYELLSEIVDMVKSVQEDVKKLK